RANAQASGKQRRMSCLHGNGLRGGFRGTPACRQAYARRGGAATAGTGGGAAVSWAIPSPRNTTMSLDPATRERIDALLGEHRVVLFMKGDRRQPMCGFSAAA